MEGATNRKEIGGKTERFDFEVSGRVLITLLYQYIIGKQ